MIINKFGGASIKDSNSIIRITALCKANISNGIIVISAMGKVTNMLEKLTLAYYKQADYNKDYAAFEIFHVKIANELFPENHQVHSMIKNLFELLQSKLKLAPSTDYDYEYDQIVPYGELLSTTIMAEYFVYSNYKVKWVDARTILKTNDTFRNAKIDWNTSSALICSEFNNVESKVYLTQGFISSNTRNLNTTLGREGSDYSAAALAFMLNAEKVTVWKDVPGVMCADPNWMSDSDKIEKLSYYDAIELAFYGAKVIHPKTIKPLQNKKIPLQVRSFINQNDEGTIIGSYPKLNIPPVYIKKDNQVLISIKPTDYSFIIEENLSHIFSVLAKNKITVNLMQNSALSFSIVVDDEIYRVKSAIKELKNNYSVKYNDELTLITIRHHKPNAEKKVLNGKVILLEQHTRSVVRYLVR